MSNATSIPGLNLVAAAAQGLLAALSAVPGAIKSTAGVFGQAAFADLSDGGSVTGALKASGGALSQAALADLSDVLAPTAWTPSLSFGLASVGMTFTAQQGLYLKIGKLIAAEFRVVLSAKGASVGNARLEGLPTTVSATSDGVLVVTRYFNMAAITSFIGTAVANTTRGNFFNSGAVSVANLTDANFTDTSEIDGMAIYIAA